MVGPPILTLDQRAFLTAARSAALATIDDRGRPRLVPVCFALASADAAGSPVLYTPLDEKPKRASDVHDLARVHDIRERPDVTLLVDRWDEDWSRLAWLRLYGTARLVEPRSDAAPEHAHAVELLRAKYPQYHGHALGALPVIRIHLTRATGWDAPGTA